MTIDPGSIDPRDMHKLLIGSVVPRPIAFVSSLSADGTPNLAPFSFFNVVCSDPPIIAFTTSYRSGQKKDTLHNVRDTREFVVNIVSDDFADAMNTTSGDYAPDVDEFVVAGLTPLPSELVRPFRVKESRVHMECRLHQIIVVSDRPQGGCLILGEVLRMHVADEILDGFRVDPDKLKAIARMGGNTYARTSDRFDLLRPIIK
jgi:flavin reductase (DIM6/NTAB) family NADH-FMN oxidoreductase RutF